MVRVASVKSVARILPKLKEHSQSCFGIYRAVILILHDEHPEIRSFLIQSNGTSIFVDKEAHSITSSSLIG
jgi:hypothetical protein